MKRVELLSPVGNMDTLYQAIHNGADAIYLAGKKYGARKYSNNFTEEELTEAIKYSHLYGVKVYITVNTIIFESEVKEFLEYIGFLYQNKVDAIIMQDIGMMSIVKRIYPNIEIHASTQCHTTNKKTVQFLKNMGCTRVVMAREVSLEEINNIDVDIEKEIFIHGALCICYSGQCLFSALNGGRSANRGECVGACRLPYNLIRNDKNLNLENKYLLSTKDLNTIFNIEKILNSNITSLKIEGRMKSPQYVGYVTKLYRKAIDNYYNGKADLITKEELKNLKILYNREFTEGYLFNKQNIVNSNSPNHIGIPIGQVFKTNKKYIYIKLDDDLSQEDGIRFQCSNKGMIANRIYNSNMLLINKAHKNNICILDNKVNLKENDIVLKTLSQELTKEIDNYPKKQIPVSFNARLFINNKLELTINDGENTITLYGDNIERAKNREVNRENITKCISKLGNTPFKLKKLIITKDENIFISLKSLNELRRKIVSELIELRKNPQRDTSRNVMPIFPKKEINTQSSKLNVLARTCEQIECCLDEGVDNIYIDDYNLYQKYKDNKNIYYRVNRIKEINVIKDDDNLLVGTLGDIEKYHKTNKLVGDYFLNVANSYTVNYLYLKNLNLTALSVELSYEQIKEITEKNNNIELIIYGTLELMALKYCPLKHNLNYCKECSSANDEFYLQDKFNNKYQLVHKNCTTYIMHSKKIDKIQEINLYQSLGIKNFRIDLFKESKNEVKDIIKKVREEQ